MTAAITILHEDARGQTKGFGLHALVKASGGVGRRGAQANEGRAADLIQRGMRSRSVMLPIAALAALLTLTAAASADVPGPKPRCDAEGRGCTECWRHYGSSPERAKSFEDCRDAAKAKGLVEACKHRQGAGDAVFFCPEGTKVETKIVGGGCVGCAMDAGTTPGAMAVIAAGLGAIAWRRRRGRR